MSAPPSRSAVVVTGYGAITALGADSQALWSGLLEGRSAITSSGDDTIPPAARVPAAFLPGVDGARATAMALAAAHEALARSGVRGSATAAVVVGSTAGEIADIEDALRALDPEGEVPPDVLLGLEKAGIVDTLSAQLGFGGPRLTVSTACASGASAILLGESLIRSGAASVVLAGGTDALARITLAGFRALRAVDLAPCRPFDRARRGLSLGEGAAMLVLERRDSAERRGATIFAELLGTAQTTDGHHLTAPLEDGSGAARAIAEALERAGLRPGDVDFVNAHGTGTPANDVAEARAIATALGPHAARCPIHSIKGSIGHTLGAAGAIEAVATVLSLATGLVPPTAGLATLDPAIALDVVMGTARRTNARIAISNSFGFGGANAVLCFGRGSD